MLFFVSKMPPFKGVAGKKVYDPFRPGRFIDRTGGVVVAGLDKRELERLRKLFGSSVGKSFTAPKIVGSGAYRVQRFMRMKRGRRHLSFGTHPVYVRRARLRSSRARAPGRRGRSRPRTVRRAIDLSSPAVVRYGTPIAFRTRIGRGGRK